ncbi:MAG: YARHG domain-containing protein [Chitinophagaceae bacterium]
MRKFFPFLLAASLIVSCKNDKKSTKVDTTSDTLTEKADNATAENQTANSTTDPALNLIEKILGSFVGPFGDNKITMLITKAEGDSIAGRTIVGGNNRPFAGTFSKAGSVYVIKATEPGDDKDDGVFSFSIDDASPDLVTGSWKPNNKAKPAKQYSLKRKNFEYNAALGNFPEASQRLLKAKDVENLMREDLEFMRNEIFARHGYCFERKHLRQQFENEDWYVPNTVDIKGFLTDVEKKNIALIKRYEKYAEEYGDEYGR